MNNTEPDLKAWRELVDRVKRPSKQVTVAIVGKYVMLSDAYISVVESLKHAGAKHDCQVNIKWVLSEDVEKKGAGSTSLMWTESSYQADWRPWY